MSVNNCKIVKKIGFIGAGRMASAIMGGIVKSGFCDGKYIYGVDVNQKALEDAKETFGINEASSIARLFDTASVIVIATKPFVIQTVLDAAKDSATSEHLIISILAGVKTSTIEEKLPSVRVIRVMPNTPAFVGEGMCAIAKGKFATDEDVKYVEKMLSNIGRTVRVQEDVIDAVTALCGSGPAFYYYIIDLMAHAAVELGLDYETALLLSAQTALGSAKMLLEGSQTPQELITAVTTPGGCTEVGNSVLQKSGLKSVFNRTLKETMEKAKALG